VRCRRERQRGLSLLEFTLVVIVISVLIVLAFERIAAVRSDMERVMIRHTVAAMREALALETVHRALDPSAGSTMELVGGNALELLDPAPSGYARGRRFSDWQAAPPGTWFYDLQRHLVVYRADNPTALPDEGSVEFAAWRVVAEAAGDSSGTTRELELKQVRP